MKNETIVVAGGGGFIGGHLVAHLIAEGYTSVRSVDIKPLNEWHQVVDGATNLSLDLSLVQRLPSTQMQEWVDERYIREELPRLVVGGHSNWEGELVPPLPHVGLFFPIFYEDKQT